MRENSSTMKGSLSIEQRIMEDLWDFDVPLDFLIGLKVKHLKFGAGIVQRVINSDSKMVIALNDGVTSITTYVDEFLDQKSLWSCRRETLEKTYLSFVRKCIAIGADLR